jgi:Ca2+-binding RTX toxin-like protein
MRRLDAVLTLALTLGALPAAADAATVSVDPVTNYAVFVGGGEANVVNSHSSPPPGAGAAPFYPAQWFTDGAEPLSVGSGCVAGAPVWCQSLGSDVSLGGGDDRYSGFSFEVIKVSGGGGDDDIAASGQATVVAGGTGADRISVGSNGRSRADGGIGDDEIRSTSGVEASLSGGRGNDLVVGQRGQSELSGDAGEDQLIVAGGSGTVSGDAGDDTILGGGDRDAISAGAGDDVVDVSGDSGVFGDDTVECGVGYDTVYADPGDVVAADCESRLDGSKPKSTRVKRALAHLADAFG